MDEPQDMISIIKQLALWLIRHFSSSPVSTEVRTIDESKNADGIWCIVANIKRDHFYGPGGRETRSGTRQFRGGTKVYIAGCNSGTCDSVLAIGQHRHSRRFIACFVNVQHVESFRAKMAHHPKVIELINNDPRCWIRTKEQAEDWVTAFPKWQRRYGSSQME